MTIRDIMIAFGYQVDKQSESKVNQSIDALKSRATKLLGAIGIGFSMTKFVALAEEFNGINDKINYAVHGLADQKEAQEAILKAANDTKTSYAGMADVVTQLVQVNRNLFPLDDAVEFASVTQKLLLSAGKSESQATSLQGTIARVFQTGDVTSSVLRSLYTQAPEVIKVVADAMGVATDKLYDLADQGVLTGETLKSAILSASGSIDKSFNGLTFHLSDAMLSIRNSWGYFIDEFNIAFDITPKIARLFLYLSNTVLSFAQKATSRIQWLAERLGGMEKITAVLGGALAATFAVMNAGKIMSAVSSIGKLAMGFDLARLKVLGLFAVFVAIALAIDDFIAFMRGEDSVIGELFARAGINADAARETIINAWAKVKSFFKGVWDGIKAGAEGFFLMIVTLVRLPIELIKLLIEWIKKAWQSIQDAFMSATEFFASVWEGVKKDALIVWTYIKKNVVKAWESIKSAWNAAISFFSGLWDSITQGLNNAWSAIKDVWDTVVSFFSDIWESITGDPLLSGIADIILLPFDTAWTTISALWEAAVAFFAGIWGLITGDKSLSDVLDAIAKPFLDAWESIKGTFNGIAEWFTNNVWNPIVGVFSGVGEFFSGVAASIWSGITAFAEDPVGWFNTHIWEPIKGVFADPLGFFSGVALSIWTGITNFTEDVGSWFTSHILDPIKGVFSLENIAQFIADFASGIWDRLTGGLSFGVTDAVEKVKGFFSNIWNGVLGVFGIQSPSTLAAEAGGYVMEGFGEGAEGKEASIGAKLSSVFSNIWDSAKSVWDGVTGWLGKLFGWGSSDEAAKNTATSDVSAAAADVASAVTDNFGEVESAISTPIINGAANGEEALRLLAEAAKTAASDIKDAMEEGLTAAVSWVTSLPSQAVVWGQDIVKSIASGIRSSMSLVTSAASAVASKIKSYLGFSEPEDGPLSDFHTYMPDMMQLMSEGIQAGKDKVKSALEAVTGDMSVIARANVVSGATTARAAGTTNNNRSITQNVNISNQFNGDQAGQKKSAEAMDKASEDVTGKLARALAFGR